MHFQLLTLIPALITVIWALTNKFKAKHIFEGITLSVCGIALTANALVVYYIIQNGVCPWFLHFIQQAFSSAIVPMAYMYFSRQMGRQWNNTTAVFCWSMMLLILIPDINIFVGHNRTLTDPALIRNFTVNVIKDESLLFSCHIADLIIFIQAMFTVARMFPTARTLRKYNLMLSKKMKGFFMWWIAAVIFIAATSFTSMNEIATPLGSWLYYISYSLLICSIYSMLALGFDLHPVVTKDEGESVDIDKFIDGNKEMASKLKRMLEDEKIYLKVGYSSEDAATALCTNRTYFSRMMNAEFGMKFSDLMTEFRINAAKTLLATTDKTVSEVAFESGFSDASYMSKKFHVLVGMTPQAYRESAKPAEA